MGLHPNIATAAFLIADPTGSAMLLHLLDGRARPAGELAFAAPVLEVDRVKPGRSGLARQCLDWTEREPHLSGPLGVHLMRTLCDQGWLRRSATTRAVTITPKGRAAFRTHLGIDAA